MVGVERAHHHRDWRADAEVPRTDDRQKRRGAMILHKIVKATAAKDLAPRTFRVVVSSEAVDRDNDRIFLDGWDLNPYRRNPVVLAFRDSRSLPVARSTDIAVTGNRLQATVQFPPVGMYDLADRIHDLVQAGFFGAASVGFIPKASQPNTFGGQDVTAAELTEVSLVAIGSNPDALVQRAAPVAMTKWLKSPQRHDDRHDIVLTVTDHPSPHKEHTMYTITKDSLGQPAGDQSANFAEVNSVLMELARKIDATFATLGAEASIAALVQDLMRPDAVGTRSLSPYVIASQAINERVARGEAENRAKALAADMLMRLQTPMHKRFKPGFQRIF
jgi:hypothetical protein